MCELGNADEYHEAYSLLWRLPRIAGLDNPMLEEERAVLTKGLRETKADAKLRTQAELGLRADPAARIFVSLGRLVRQKGVDLLADVAPWLLEGFPDAQLVVVGPVGDGFGYYYCYCYYELFLVILLLLLLLVGPVGDGFGEYAAQKLCALAEDPRYSGRLFVRCEFMQVSEDLKFAADFCLMPSRDEPFGYVDVEFAWHGALLVGAHAGSGDPEMPRHRLRAFKSKPWTMGYSRSASTCNGRFAEGVERMHQGGGALVARRWPREGARLLLHRPEPREPGALAAGAR